MNSKLSFRKQFRNATGLLLLIALSLYLTSCKSGTDKTEAQETSTSGSSDTTIKKTTANLGDFPVLCVDKNLLLTYFENGTGPQVQKLVFSFTWDDSKNLNPSLSVYKAKQNGEFISTQAETTLTPYNLSLPIQGISLVGNLELTRTKYDRMLKNSGTNPSLVFYPVQSGENGQRVTYRIAWGNCNALPKSEEIPAILMTGEELNPCPPNHPGQGQ